MSFHKIQFPAEISYGAVGGPQYSTTVVIDNGSPRAGFALDTTNGTFELDTVASGAILTWFEFDVPCRFDTDEMGVSLEFYNSSNWQNIPIVELQL